jgi:hypothetical protein
VRRRSWRRRAATPARHPLSLPVRHCESDNDVIVNAVELLHLAFSLPATLVSSQIPIMPSAAVFIADGTEEMEL